MVKYNSPRYGILPALSALHICSKLKGWRMWICLHTICCLGLLDAKFLANVGYDQVSCEDLVLGDCSLHAREGHGYESMFGCAAMVCALLLVVWLFQYNLVNSPRRIPFSLQGSLFRFFAQTRKLSQLGSSRTDRLDEAKAAQKERCRCVFWASVWGLRLHPFIRQPVLSCPPLP